MALLAFAAPAPGSGLPAIRRSAPLAALAVAAFLAYVTMCIGAYVSSSGAGLACTTFPSCDGTLVGTTPPELVQMLHRMAAGAVRDRRARRGRVRRASGMRRMRAWTFAGAALALLQVALGIGNVLMQLPMPLREAHAANAAVTFIVFVVATFLATLDTCPPARAVGTGLSMGRAV